MCATWKRRLGEVLDLCVVCMCCTGKVAWKGTSLIAHSNSLSQVSAQLIPVSRPVSDSPLVWSFSTALFLNSHCMINTFPSADVILIQRLFYWHYLLLTIYWSNIMMLVLYHYYFTVKFCIAIQAQISTSASSYHATVSVKDTMEITSAWNTECSD